MSPRRGSMVRRLGVVATVVLLAGTIDWHPRPAYRHAHAEEVASGPERKQLWTCGMHPEVIRDAPGLCPICHMKLTPLVPSGGTPTAVVIDPVVVQNMGLRLAAARVGTLRRTIRATAYLDQAEPNIRDVNLRVSGWIEKLEADTVGMHVEAGAPIFELYSPELQVAVEELIAGTRLGATHGGEGAGVPSEARKALLQSTRRKLELFGLTPAQIDRLARLATAPRTITFTSPITGHVTEKLVVAGAAVKAGERVLQIVDHSTLWLDVQIHAGDLPAVRLGQTITATIEGSNREVEGVVIFVHPHVDPATRAATVRARVANPDLTLRPGMYATARIDGTTTDEAVLVPREAVIDTGRRQLVFVAMADGKFEPRDVAIGATGDDGQVQILRGVAAAEQVVTSGQFLLDAESRTQEAIQKYLAERRPAARP